MPVTDAVVPVAGLGTRLEPMTGAVPKELLPLGAKPVVQRVIEELSACGIERVLLVSRRGKEAIERHFEGLDGLGVEVRFAHQAEPRGVGDALLAAAPVGAAVAVALGDTVIGGVDGRASRIVARLAEAFERHGAVAAVAVEEVRPEDVERYGIVAPAGDGDELALAGLVEKPSPAAAPSRLAIASRYVLSPEVFDELARTPPGRGGEVQLTDALASLAARSRPVIGVRLRPGERRHDVGDPRSYARAFEAFARADGLLP